jgi:hypothetical protein
MGNCVADAAFALFAPNVYIKCVLPNEKCDIYSKAGENGLRERQTVCIGKAASRNITFPQNQNEMYSYAVNMHYSVVVKQTASWTRCISDEFAILVSWSIYELTKTHANVLSKAVP